MATLAERIDIAAHRAQAAMRGETILYKRGTSVTEITDAIPRASENLVDTATGSVVAVSHQDLDWSILAGSLILNGALAKPQSGDRIVRVDYGGETFEVQLRGNEECWRWTNPRKTKIRFHTRRIQ